MVSLFAIGCGGSGGKGSDLGSGKLAAVTGELTSTGTGTPTPISGATVSLVGTTTTTTSGADGSFSIMAPQSSTIFVSASLSGYVSSEWGFQVTGSGGEIANTQMISTANLTSTISGLSPALTIDQTKGLVVVQFDDGSSTGTAGYTASISATHGDAFSPDNSMYTSTTPGGDDSDNPIVFPNVAPGMTTVTVSSTGKTCAPEGAILDWRVDAATITWIRYACQ